MIKQLAAERLESRKGATFCLCRHTLHMLPVDGERKALKKTQLDFQAVLLAGGKGSRLYPLTEGCAKPLLSVSNRPLIWFQLAMLEREGFSDVLVITNTDTNQDISRWIEEKYTGRLSIVLHACEPGVGTADALRSARDKIKSDFLVVSGDLVTNIYLSHLQDLHRARKAAVTLLLCREAENKDPRTGKVKSSDDARKQFIGLAQPPQAKAKRDAPLRLVYFKSASDIEGEIRINKVMLRKHPSTQLHTDLQDAHLYLMAHWVLTVLDKNPQISSLQAELLPYLVKLPFLPPHADYPPLLPEHEQLVARMSHFCGPELSAPMASAAGPASPAKKTRRPSYSPASPISLPGHPHPHTVGADLAATPSSSSGASSSSFSAAAAATVPSTSSAPANADAQPAELPAERPTPREPVRCYALICPSNLICSRVCTIESLMQVNHTLATSVYEYMPWGPASEINQLQSAIALNSTAQLGRQCMVGSNLKIGAGSKLKRTVVGNHCTIGAKVSLNNCVLMDLCIIEDGCKLESTVLSSGVRVQADSTLTNCSVGPHFVVPAKSNLKKEQLSSSEAALMEEEEEEERG